MPQRLVSDLQVLVAETRRKYPEVRQAAENVLQRLQGDAESTLATLRSCRDLSQHTLLQTIILSCETRTPKVIQISLSLLQRSITLHALPDEAISMVIDVLHKLLSAPGRTDVDVQLKILQTVSGLLSMYPSVTNTQLSRALMLCFTLYEHSRVAVVSSTAAATLRQNIMMVFEKVHEEDNLFDSIKNEDAAATAPLPVATAQLPDGPVTLFPCSSDAYHLLNDLCTLADGEPATFLPLQALSKPFVLELLESVLINHPRLFSQGRHPELVYILRSAACPFLLKALSEPHSFSIYVRIVRLVRLLLREFSEEVVLEIEILLQALLRTTDEKHALWQRVLAWETIRALCADASFLQRLWDWYDGRGTPQPPAVLAGMIATLQQASRRAKHGLLLDQHMVAALEQRPSQPTTPSRRTSQTLYNAAMAGVKSAAEGFLSGRQDTLQPSSQPAVALLDQLDKMEAPMVGTAILPATYIPLLLLQSLTYLAHGLAAMPPSYQQAMLAVCSHPLNESLCVFLTVQGADEYFEQALQALATLAQVTGKCPSLEKERDRLLSSLCDVAVPSSAYSTRQVHSRNKAAQAALAYVCCTLGPHLGTRWRVLMQCLAQALACLGQEETAKLPAELDALAGITEGPRRWLSPEMQDKLPRLLRGVFEQAATWDDVTMDQFAQTLMELTQDQMRDAPDSSPLPDVLVSLLERFARRGATRMVARMPQGAWPTLQGLRAHIASASIAARRRLSAAHVYTATMYVFFRALPTKDGSQQRWLIQELTALAILEHGVQASDVSIRRVALETLHTLLASHGHSVHDGWDLLLKACDAAAQDAQAIREAGTAPVPMLRTAFACLQLICASHIQGLKDADVERCMQALPSFSRQQEDVAMALSANAALWDLTEEVERRQKTHAVHLWLTLLHRWRDVAQVPQADVANGALAHLFQVLVQYGSSLRAEDWERVMKEVLLPLLETPPLPPLAFEGAAQIFCMVSVLHSMPSWASIWSRWLRVVEQTYAHGDARVGHAAIDALRQMVQHDSHPAVTQWPATWASVQALCTMRPQASLDDLHALVELLQALYQQRTTAWQEQEQGHMLEALRTCLIQGLARVEPSTLGALQRLAMMIKSTMDEVRTAAPSAALAQRTLVCMQACMEAAWDRSRQTSSSTPPRIQTACMDLARTWLQYWLATYQPTSDEATLYVDAVPAMLVWLLAPLHAFPGVPPAHIWYTAMDVLTCIHKHGPRAVSRVPNATPFWEALFATTSQSVRARAQHVLRADECEAVQKLLCALERETMPRAGAQADAHEPLTTFVPTLVLATHLYQTRRTPHRPTYTPPWEEVAYLVWDMLCRLCDAATTPDERHIASLVLPIVLTRCADLLTTYVADLQVRGAMPMPRIYIEEINYILAFVERLQVPSDVSLPGAPTATSPAQHLFLLGPALDAMATMPMNVCAAPQTAFVGSSLRLQHDTADPVQRTSPQALAQKALVRRTAALMPT